MISVLIVDDQGLIRAGFRALLQAQPDMEVVGEGNDGDEAVELASRLRPDVVLMDIRMPGTNGIDATRRICADPSEDRPRILILTTFDLDEYVYEGLLAGASGFLLKDTEPADLLRAIRLVARGETLLASSVTRRLIEHFTSHSRASAPADALSSLTEREREVLTLVAQGLSNDEIAARLFISPTTAKTHVSRTMSKLGARDRAQLVITAYETGLAQPGWQL